MLHRHRGRYRLCTDGCWDRSFRFGLGDWDWSRSQSRIAHWHRSGSTKEVRLERVAGRIPLLLLLVDPLICGMQILDAAASIVQRAKSLALLVNQIRNGAVGGNVAKGEYIKL